MPASRGSARSSLAAAVGTLCLQPLSKAVGGLCSPWTPVPGGQPGAHRPPHSCLCLAAAQGRSRGSRASHRLCDKWVALSTPSTLRPPATSPAEGRGQEHSQRPRDPGGECACPWVPGLLWGSSATGPRGKDSAGTTAHVRVCAHIRGASQPPRLAWLLWGTGSPMGTSAGPR